MSPVSVTWRRTLGQAFNHFSTILSFACFLAAAAALFAFRLQSAEGGRVSLAALWTVSVAPVLPVLAAFLGMDVWSEERKSGRVDALLSAPVSERDLTVGKFLGVWTLLVASVLFFHFSTLAFLLVFAPSLLSDFPMTGFLPGFVALMLQGALWCAVSVAASAAFRHGATAALATVVALVAVPRGLWHAFLNWSPQGRTSLGEMPLDAHVWDMASGLFSTGAVLSYAVLAAAALFAATLSVSSLRWTGRGARGKRVALSVALALCAVLAGASVALVQRLDLTVDLPAGGVRENRFSPRTRNILSETRGEIVITAFLSRRDARFRPLAHFLRALARESESLGGARLTLRYVDPVWDLGAAERLVRAGATQDSLVFERSRRLAVLPLAEGYGERSCASSILRIAMPSTRRTVYWTTGHGEASFDAYGNWGMSDIARDLARDGYRNLALDLASDAPIPSDCALIVVAGARNEFSHVETGRLNAYLSRGGRLLVLLNSAETGGLATMLSRWGLRTGTAVIPGARTLSGTDVIVSDFSDHAATAPLRGSQIVLERPVVFEPSAVASGTGVDRVEFTPLATLEGFCVAAAGERGAQAGADLAIRPTRVVAVGDAGFVMNGQLEAKANANRDFFLNCVAFLSGTDAMTESGMEADRLVSGLDRAGRLRFLAASAGLLPAAVFLFLSLLLALRRRR